MALVARDLEASVIELAAEAAFSPASVAPRLVASATSPAVCAVETRDDRQLERQHRRFQNFALLVVDELGFVPFDKVESELLCNLLADRYERRSTIQICHLAVDERVLKGVAWSSAGSA